MPQESRECLTYEEKSLYNRGQEPMWYIQQGLHEKVFEHYEWITWLEEGIKAQESTELTEFEGKIEEANTQVLVPMCGKDKKEEGEDISASRLQRFARCPYSYFMQYVLKIQKTEEIAYDPWKWLNPADLGTVYHEIFENFYNCIEASIQLLKTGQSSEEETLDNWQSQMEMEVKRVLEKWRKKIATPSEYIQKREEEAIREVCLQFVVQEVDYWLDEKKVKPYGYEVPFGKLFGLANIQIGDEKWLRVNGKIDRVDELTHEEYLILDYKSGKSKGYEVKKPNKKQSAADISDYDKYVLKGGKNLQHMLYAMAYESLRGSKEAAVNYASYYFVKEDKKQKQILVDVGVRSKERELGLKYLQSIIEMMESGYFIRNCNEQEEVELELGNACKYCDYRSLCIGQRCVGALRRKCSYGRELAFYEQG